MTPSAVQLHPRHFISCWFFSQRAPVATPKSSVGSPNPKNAMTGLKPSMGEYASRTVEKKRPPAERRPTTTQIPPRMAFMCPLFTAEPFSLLRRAGEHTQPSGPPQAKCAPAFFPGDQLWRQVS